MKFDATDLKTLIDRYNREFQEQYSPTPQVLNSEDPILDDQEHKIIHSQAETPASQYTDIGQLQVRVSIENQAVPIPGAVVTVTDKQESKNHLIRTMITDESGLTPFIDLPTKDRQLTLTPNQDNPYAVYTVDVTADGYFPKRFINLPIYGGVAAIQNVTMIPLPENGSNDMVLSYPQYGPLGL